MMTTLKVILLGLVCSTLKCHSYDHHVASFLHSYPSDLGDHDAVHVRVWKGFQDDALNALDFKSIETGKSVGDDITYF